MARRAGVPERAFYEVFASFEDCVLAAFEEGLERYSQAVQAAAAREQAWLGRVRAGVVALLGFLDDEPQWGRLLLLEAPLAGPAMLGCEQRTLGVLTQLLDDRAPHTYGEPAPASQLTAELAAGGAFAVIRARMRGDGTHETDEAASRQTHGPRESLVELAPSLMSFIVRPYLGEAIARAELSGAPASAATVAVPGDALPIRATHRTTLVLRAICAAPGSTNRQVADAAGLADEGQTSKLLARLERHRLVENVGVGAARGEPNAWLLTAEGERVLELLGESFGGRAPRRGERAARRAGGRIRGGA